MINIKVRKAAEAQAVYDALPHADAWINPIKVRGWHQVIARSVKFEDVLALVTNLHIAAIIEEL
jgi:hypothetical protein